MQHVYPRDHLIHCYHYRCYNTHTQWDASQRQRSFACVWRLPHAQHTLCACEKQISLLWQLHHDTHHGGIRVARRPDSCGCLMLRAVQMEALYIDLSTASEITTDKASYLTVQNPYVPIKSQLYCVSEKFKAIKFLLIRVEHGNHRVLKYIYIPPRTFRCWFLVARVIFNAVSLGICDAVTIMNGAQHKTSETTLGITKGMDSQISPDIVCCW